MENQQGQVDELKGAVSGLKTAVTNETAQINGKLDELKSQLDAAIVQNRDTGEVLDLSEVIADIKSSTANISNIIPDEPAAETPSESQAPASGEGSPDGGSGLGEELPSSESVP